jgi:hypothetical protein
MTLRARPKTDMYLAAVEEAVERPGRWITIPRTFKTRTNAQVTAGCLGSGYLRVQPRDGDRLVKAEGKPCIATAAPVTARVDARPNGEWTLRIRFDG